MPGEVTRIHLVPDQGSLVNLAQAEQLTFLARTLVPDLGIIVTPYNRDLVRGGAVLLVAEPWTDAASKPRTGRIFQMADALEAALLESLNHERLAR